MSKKNEFNPDYETDPVVLRGALQDAAEAIGELQDDLKAAGEKNRKLEKENKQLKQDVKTAYGAFLK